MGQPLPALPPPRSLCIHRLRPRNELPPTAAPAPEVRAPLAGLSRAGWWGWSHTRLGGGQSGAALGPAGPQVPPLLTPPTHSRCRRGAGCCRDAGASCPRLPHQLFGGVSSVLRVRGVSSRTYRGRRSSQKESWCPLAVTCCPDWPPAAADLPLGLQTRLLWTFPCHPRSPLCGRLRPVRTSLLRRPLKTPLRPGRHGDVLGTTVECRSPVWMRGCFQGGARAVAPRPREDAWSRAVRPRGKTQPSCGPSRVSAGSWRGSRPGPSAPGQSLPLRLSDHGGPQEAQASGGGIASSAGPAVLRLACVWETV
ncbi:uncharacterized protein LOC131835403 [Mustela lutreola]|uniref:uncharacterized protein LOC131835403 n=1 Tax=Mustela lutreola TaxID=9666 RepID=UPI00279736D4|nr:uncharacterized protein LOC131835403 [Mustela lutreola]